MSVKSVYKMKNGVWLYPGETSNWHFLTLPKKESAEIKERFWTKKRGWNSLPVEAIIGKTGWTTSIFFDTRSDAYLLPLKAAVRRKENIRQGDTVAFQIRIRV